MLKGLLYELILKFSFPVKQEIRTRIVSMSRVLLTGFLAALIFGAEILFLQKRVRLTSSDIVDRIVVKNYPATINIEFVKGTIELFILLRMII